VGRWGTLGTEQTAILTLLAACRCSRTRWSLGGARSSPPDPNLSKGNSGAQAAPLEFAVWLQAELTRCTWRSSSFAIFKNIDSGVVPDPRVVNAERNTPSSSTRGLNGQVLTVTSDPCNTTRVSDEFAGIVMRALARDPAERFQSAKEMQAAVQVTSCPY
jgi:hypothetical protein